MLSNGDVVNEDDEDASETPDNVRRLKLQLLPDGVGVIIPWFSALDLELVAALFEFSFALESDRDADAVRRWNNENIQWISLW